MDEKHQENTNATIRRHVHINASTQACKSIQLFNINVNVNSNQMHEISISSGTINVTDAGAESLMHDLVPNNSGSESELEYFQRLSLL